MPFSHKNASATYQRMVKQMFTKLIGISMEIYVDDILVKKKHERRRPHKRLVMGFLDLEGVKMKLNPNKCTLTIVARKSLDFIISQKRIEANPKKI